MDKLPLALASALFAISVTACDVGSFCYPTTQSALNEDLLNPRCSVVSVSEFDGERLDATTEREDVELWLDVDGGEARSPLKHAAIDNLSVSMSTGFESATVTRYVGGTIEAREIDVTLDERDIGAVGFNVAQGGRVRIRSTRSMERWVTFIARASPTWEGVTVEVDPSAHPVNLLQWSEPAGITLQQLQQFGSRAEEIIVGDMAADTLDRYAEWLESEAFAGTLARFLGEEPVLPRPP